MIPYFGSKGRIAKFYPKPKHNLIIEPFAGSAKYSLRHFENEIILVERFEKLFIVWQYLQVASPKDILGLPRPKYKENLNSYDLSKEEKLFLGFIINGAVARPKLTVQKFSHVDRDLANIAKQLFKIKHWQIILGDCFDVLENKEATWFVDPPYQFGGEEYNFKQPDYHFLAKWCRERNGQLIVCENTKADWLPFQPLVKMNGSFHQTIEAIYTNENQIIPQKQNELF